MMLESLKSESSNFESYALDDGQPMEFVKGGVI